MKRVLFLMLLLASPAMACEVGAPYDWKSDPACSDKAMKIMERIGGCLHFMGEEPYNKKRAAFINKSITNLQCSRLTCDYDAASSADHAVIKEYIGYQFTDEKEFRGVFPPKTSCKAPAAAKKKPAAKPVVSTKPVKPAAPKKPTAAPTTKKTTTKPTKTK
jgi:hypothetical protein